MRDEVHVLRDRDARIQAKFDAGGNHGSGDRTRGAVR